MAKIKLIDFYSETCGPCKMMLPVLDELKETYREQIEIVKIDAEKEKAKANEFGVMGVPTLFLYVDEELVYFGKGYHPAELLEGKIQESLGA